MDKHGLVGAHAYRGKDPKMLNKYEGHGNSLISDHKTTEQS